MYDRLTPGISFNLIQGEHGLYRFLGVGRVFRVGEHYWLGLRCPFIHMKRNSKNPMGRFLTGEKLNL